MGLEEPCLGIDWHRADDTPLTIGAAIGDQAFNALNHAKLRIRKRGVLRIHPADTSIFLLGRRLVRDGFADPNLVGQRRLGKESKIGVANVDRFTAAAQIKVIVLNDHAGRVRNASHFDGRR